MKKAYETPKAIKYVFDYTDNVVASNGKNGRTGPSSNSCHTGNTADVSSGCSATNDKQPHQC